jgi:hypothetical protein
MRDQLQVIQQVLADPEASKVADEAMTFCHQNKINSAVDFKAIIEQHLKDSKPKEEKSIQILNPLSGSQLDKNIQPQKSSIEDYPLLGLNQQAVLLFSFFRDAASQLRKVFKQSCLSWRC